MHTKINWPRAVQTVLMIAAADLWLAWTAKPTHGFQKAPAYPAYRFVAEAVLIFLGIAGQIWMADRPKLKVPRVILYYLTLGWALSLGFITILTLLAKLKL